MSFPKPHSSYHAAAHTNRTPADRPRRCAGGRSPDGANGAGRLREEEGGGGGGGGSGGGAAGAAGAARAARALPGTGPGRRRPPPALAGRCLAAAPAALLGRASPPAAGRFAEDGREEGAPAAAAVPAERARGRRPAAEAEAGRASGTVTPCPAARASAARGAGTACAPAAAPSRAHRAASQCATEAWPAARAAKTAMPVGFTPRRLRQMEELQTQPSRPPVSPSWQCGQSQPWRGGGGGGGGGGEGEAPGGAFLCAAPRAVPAVPVPPPASSLAAAAAATAAASFSARTSSRLVPYRTSRHARQNRPLAPPHRQHSDLPAQGAAASPPPHRPQPASPHSFFWRQKWQVRPREAS